MLRAKFMTLNAYIRKVERSKIISFHLRKLEKQQQNKYKASRRKLIKTRAESNDSVNKLIEKNYKTKSLLLCKYQ